ncbi:MAG TPA: DNA alkylation repair protein [Nocardioidaceae bacterium]
MTADHALVDAVTEGLRSLADPAAAPQMQRYMKSAMPYLGVKMPVVRQLTRRLYAEHVLADRATWEDTVRALFDQATYREERYAALMLVGHRRYAYYLDAAALPLLEHVIAAGAWWDIVDDVSHRVGDALRTDRRATEAVVRGWIGADDIWLRRAAIICQLGHRTDTDVTLLQDAILPAMHEREFFLRKAIGWALREYAKTDPDWVRRFVATHQEELSALSRREALRNLPG